MLRTTRWVAAIIFLYSFPGYAEETFDTHFMIGGMRGEKVSEYRFDNKQPLPGNYELDFYVNHQWRGKKDITIPESPAKPCLISQFIFFLIQIIRLSISASGIS